MVDILQEFLSESREGLDQLDLDFIADIVLDEYKTSLLLEMVDVVREQLDMIAATGGDGGDYQSLIDRLEAEVNGTGVSDTGNSPDTSGAGAEPDAGAPEMVAAIVDDDDDELTEVPEVAELDDEMKEVLKDFLQESFENLDRVDSELIELQINAHHQGNLRVLWLRQA